MKSNKLSLMCKVLVTCVIAAVCSLLYTGEAAHASNKKNANCYLNYVTAEAHGKSYGLYGGLKPHAVSEDVTWQEFFSDLKITDYEVVLLECDGSSHAEINAYIDMDGKWLELFTYNIKEDVTYFQLEDAEFKENYYDVKIEFAPHSGSDSYTVIYARFAKEYKVSYELNGGRFEGKGVDTYTSGVDYNIPNPVKEGYEFVGWTGAGLINATKDLIIKNGTSGNKLYVANWVEVKTDGVTDGSNGIGKDNGATTNNDVTKVAVKAPARAKITSVKKLLTSKKVKLSIKKVAGAVGYNIQYSTTKKFKKVLYTKTVKKANVVMNSKKLKNKKKLYVRVKAYKLDGNAKVWAKKWSKSKKVEIQ